MTDDEWNKIGRRLSETYDSEPPSDDWTAQVEHIERKVIHDMTIGLAIVALACGIAAGYMAGSASVQPQACEVQIDG